MRKAERQWQRARPLSDPKRAPYVRAVLDRKQRAAERSAAKARDDNAQVRGLEHIRACIALVEGDET